MRKKLFVLFSVMMVGAMLLSACGPRAQKAEVATGEDLVTLNINWQTEPPTLDPSLATDTTSVDVLNNLFVGLTQFDPVSGEVSPALATDWESGTDDEGNQTWTFTMRDDVPWVKFNAETGEVVQEVDEEGEPHFVDASDVVYGFRRTVDPETGSDYSYITYVIKNAQPINSGDEAFTVEDLGVEMVDDFTVRFTLENPAGYFPAIAGLWIGYPMPQWAIEASGEEWTEPENIVTNGPYVLEEWVHGAELNMVKNPLWINADDVQIERVEGVMITEASTGFALYENNELDTAAVPLPEMDRVRADPELSEQYTSAPDPCTYYYGFTNNKPPFDDVRVRRAFTQSIDRQSLIDNVLKGGQIPATSFAPPGIFGAPEPGQVGLEYDSEAAQAAFQEYLDENGMTVEDFNAMDVVLMHNTSEGHARIAAAIQQMWTDTLGVEVRVENQEWAVYLNTIENESPLEDMPHVWRLGWCADYPDENNWIHEVFNANAGANRLRREPTEFDEITAQAAKAQDPAEREELYLEAERMLAEDEVAYAPIYHYSIENVTKPWVERNFPPLGGIDIYNWTIDMAAKEAAQ